MDITLTGEYRSLKDFSWIDVPSFAIITGVNGAGKSQLLRLLAWSQESNAWLAPDDEERAKLRGAIVNFHGINIEPWEILLVAGGWPLDGRVATSVAEIQRRRSSVAQQIHGPQFLGLRKELEPTLERPLGHLDQTQISKILPDDFFLSSEPNIATEIANIFLKYRMEVAGEREVGHRSDDDIRQKYGQAPWDLLNDILNAAEIPYRVRSPLGTKFYEDFEIAVFDPARDIDLPLRDLSSGEKVVIGTALWLYRAQNFKRRPKLLLLDEPDGHLHPSMTRNFLRVMRDVFVAKLGMRVIMTTHSPSTVALASDGEVFEMRRDEPRIMPVSRDRAVSILTSGFVSVTPATRFVLVEDEADATFYSALWEILTEKTPIRGGVIEATPSLVFLRASIGQARDRIGGGRTVVAGWVQKLRATGPVPRFAGLVDRDTGEDAGEGVEILVRYCLENYLLYPPVLLSLAIENEGTKEAMGVKLAVGDQHKIAVLPAGMLQAFIRPIITRLQDSLENVKSEELEPVVVEYTNGVSLKYPRWLIDRSGKDDLLAAAQRTFGKNVYPKNLRTEFQRVRMVPVELPGIFRRLQLLD